MLELTHHYIFLNSIICYAGLRRIKLVINFIVESSVIAIIKLKVLFFSSFELNIEREIGDDEKEIGKTNMNN